MKAPLVFLVLVGLTYVSKSSAWKVNTEYVYFVNARTLTSLHEVSDQYSGIFLRAKLHITPLSDRTLQCRIPVGEYAQIHSHLPGGWSTEVPDSELTYKPLDLVYKSFQVKMEDGVIRSLIMEEDTSNWEANIIKSIVSQFQLDVKGKNAIPSPINDLPKDDEFDGVFKTMEETITGETETTYDIHRLPEYIIQSQPWLVPQPTLKGDGQIIEIIKNKNYTNNDESPAYHYGFGEIIDGHPTFNRMGKFYSRQSSSHAVITGKLSKYTVQSSYTVNKIVVNPTLNAKEQGSVVSCVNVTLQIVRARTAEPQTLVHPIEIGNLIYTYDSPFSHSSRVHPKMEGDYFPEPASEDRTECSRENSLQRIRRTVGPIIRKLQGSYDSATNLNNKNGMQYQERPAMSKAPDFPFLPYNVGYLGRSIKTNSEFNLKQNVKRIAKEIGEDVEHSEKILTHSTLSKYVMLCSLTRLMDDDEIRSVAREIYTQSKNGHERLTWVAFRDAVADAGTGPAFLNIQEWIETKKIEKEEASEVIAAMSNAVRVPTEEYMHKFFELVKKPEVCEQANLNETALLVYTDLLYKVYVNRNLSYSEYPVYSFRNFYTKEGQEFVKSTVIPYLTEKLQNAVSQADSRKIHVYIRALGNIGHKKILKAFEPYLEGDKQVSQFQRMLMVLSMDKIVESNPVVAYSVLYKIYQNTAEIPEVRVVAVYQLMKTNPPAEMIERMAENTNTDPQEEVNAAVKSIIQSASQLESVELQELQKAAESAKHLLTKKEYGKQQSLNVLQEFIVKNLDLELHHNLLQVGSSDSNLPKGIQYVAQENLNGMKNYKINIQTVVSSVEQLINIFYKKTTNRRLHEEPQLQAKEGIWSSPKIADWLNLQTNEREQLEGFLYAQIEHIHQLWSFDNETIAKLPEVIREKEEMLSNGKEISYSKLRKLKEMVLSLPTEMGLSFVYTYDQLMLAQFAGRIKAVATPEISRDNKLNMPEKISADINGYVTVSGKVQSRLQVVTPFDHQIYTAGFDNNMQAHLPVKSTVKVDLKNKEIEIEFVVAQSPANARLLHYSSWPYTSVQDIMSLSPLALSSSTYLIKPQDNSHRSFDFVLGQKEIGISFRVWGHHQQQSKNLLDLVNILQTSDISTIWQLVWDEASLHQTEANIALIPEQTTTSKVVIRMGYKGRYQKEPEKEHECSLEQLASKVQQELKSRQKEMLECVGAGIKSAKLKTFDVSVEFQGDQSYKHMFTLAFGKSNVAPQSRLVALYRVMSRQPTEFVVQVRSDIPNTSGLDLTYSLKSEPKAKYNVSIHYRQWDQGTSKMEATVGMSRSEERKKYIERLPLYQVCKKQMKEGNRQLPACQNLTIESNYLDDIKVQLQYENIKKEWARVSENIFKSVRLFYYPQTEIRSVQSEEENQICLDLQFEPENLRYVNITVKANHEETKMFNLSISETAKTVMVPHPEYHLQARLLGKFMEQDNFRPTCVIDQKAAQTFSNLTYPLSLGEDWSLMMQYIPQEARPSGKDRQTPAEQLKDQSENFAVLVRKHPAEQKDIKVVFKHPETNGQTVEITMMPKQKGSKPFASVMVDGKEVKFDDRQAAQFYNELVEIYALPNGEVKLEFQNWFHIIFDGDRVKLTATSDNLRDSVVGLCGRFSEDRYEDFWTPSNCIVRSAEKFAKSFVLGQKRQEQQQWSQNQYYECIPKVLPLYVDVISEYDVEGADRENSDESNTTTPKLRSRYVEEKDEICFTIHPVPVCENLTRDYTTKDVPVHCITNSKTANHFKNLIQQGGNPDFSAKPVSKTIQMEIPKQCL